VAALTIGLHQLKEWSARQGVVLFLIIRPDQERNKTLSALRLPRLPSETVLPLFHRGSFGKWYWGAMAVQNFVLERFKKQKRNAQF